MTSKQKIKSIEREEHVLQGTAFQSPFSLNVFEVPPPALEAHVNSLLEVIDHSFALVINS